jgi:hypothetical protein
MDIGNVLVPNSMIKTAAGKLDTTDWANFGGGGTPRKERKRDSGLNWKNQFKELTTGLSSTYITNSTISELVETDIDTATSDAYFASYISIKRTQGVDQNVYTFKAYKEAAYTTLKGTATLTTAVLTGTATVVLTLTAGTVITLTVDLAKLTSITNLATVGTALAPITLTYTTAFSNAAMTGVRFTDYAATDFDTATDMRNNIAYISITRTFDVNHSDYVIKIFNDAAYTSEVSSTAFASALTTGAHSETLTACTDGTVWVLNFNMALMFAIVDTTTIGTALAPITFTFNVLQVANYITTVSAATPALVDYDLTIASHLKVVYFSIKRVAGTNTYTVKAYNSAAYTTAIGTVDVISAGTTGTVNAVVTCTGGTAFTVTLNKSICSAITTATTVGSAAFPLSFTTEIGFTKRLGFATYVLNGKLFLCGGVLDTTEFNDIWSTVDGVTWVQEDDAAAFSARYNHTAVVMDGIVYLIGGHDGTALLADVWSSPDGVVFTRIKTDTTAQFSRRRWAPCVAYKGALYLFGVDDGSGTKTDVWSSTDGITWTELVASTNVLPWTGDMNTSVVVIDEDIVVIPSGVTFASVVTNKNIYKTKDGFNFTEYHNVARPSRPMSTYTTYDDMIFCLGGMNADEGNEECSELWYSPDGLLWYRITEDTGTGNRVLSNFIEYDQHLYILGGFSDTANVFPTTYYDVWESMK